MFNPGTPILVKRIETGEVRRFLTIRDGAHFMKKHRTTVTRRLQYHNGLPFEDGFAVKYDDDSPWIEREPVVAPQHHTLVVWNVFTKEQQVVDGVYAAGRLTGIKPTAITKHLTEERTAPMYGYLFRVLTDDLKPWPLYSHWQMELFKKERGNSGGRGILVRDTETGKDTLYLQDELAERLGVHVSTVRRYAGQGKTPCGNYLLTWITPDGHQPGGRFTYPSRPHPHRRGALPKPVVGYNVFTNVTRRWSSVEAIPKNFIVSRTVIRTALWDKRTFPTNGWLFQYDDGAVLPWPRYNKYQLQLFADYHERGLTLRSDAKGVLVFDSLLNTTTFYTQRGLAERLALSVRGVIQRVKKGSSPCGYFRYTEVPATSTWETE